MCIKTIKLLRISAEMVISIATPAPKRKHLRKVRNTFGRICNKTITTVVTGIFFIIL